MAKFLVHRRSIEEIEVEAETADEALKIAYDAGEDEFTEIDYSWSVDAGPIDLAEDVSADEG